MDGQSTRLAHQKPLWPLWRAGSRATKKTPRRFLIDLDLAIRESRNKGSGAQWKTGTRAFMAIGLLFGEPHCFMHDLESFFWVLFWACVNHDGGSDRSVKNNLFDHWNYAKDYDLAGSKLGVITDSFIPQSCWGMLHSVLRAADSNDG
ncbi:Non-specific serine/threonine protein kinase [Trichoderma simmonsii]|uniref:Non-specific serine/threonine protein kinase n=1 Tax=Trichoderma simmonsii TaxID=1491479 RepID=A0A8G0PDW4_9HYPO|nr:Non-specific serine/threonine protein kinase [Trichoderma simmonsii]